MVPLTIFLAKFLPRTAAFDRIAVSATIDSHVELKDAGRAETLIGRKGKAVTPLRPSGIGEFDGKRRDVVAAGDFIDQDSEIVIAEVHGNRIVVEEIESV